MKNLKFLNKFYLDKEKDIIINLYQPEHDEMTYIIETPNHGTGNLISNLAKLCETQTIKNENDMKVIKGKMEASLNGDNEEVFILRLGGIKIANIYPDGKIERKAKIPAISKTLMSQTKNYNLPIEKTIVKTYIFKKAKFRTDLHTHMNANLSPDVLIALGIKHQIKYPLYYIKKLNLKITKEQEEKIMEQRKIVEKQFENSPLTGKYLTRKIDDNTFINFADFILNNLENAIYNINKIRTSLTILKDGQAVFTNLEKLYIYRYVFAKGIPNSEKIKLEENKIDLIPEEDIKQMVKQMQWDIENAKYKDNNLRKDKFLWIAREYQKQGIKYVEIADTTLTKANGAAIELIEEIHEIMPEIEKETGVKIRFLAAIRRIPLFIIKDQKTENNYLRENLDVIKAIAKSPYVVGSDIIGEEINDISELKPVIEELVQYEAIEDNGFTIRIHAGENDSLRDNVAKAIECVKTSVKSGQKLPRFRIGHGLYTADLKSKEGKELLKEMVETGAVLEFQMTSNVRLNNLNNLDTHPLKQYLKAGVKCVQGTDGCGFYGFDTIDEQLALQNLLNLSTEDFMQMREVEEEIIKHAENYFEEKSKRFEEFLGNRTIKEALLEVEEQNRKNSEKHNIKMRVNDNIESEKILKEKIKELPLDKIPIIIAGGSFNAKGKETIVTEEGKKILEQLIKSVNSKNAYFVIGHKMQGYEEEIVNLNQELDKNFEINAIVPRELSKQDGSKLKKTQLNGIRIAIDNDEMGIYKSFNYEIFERRKSVVVAFDGNSPVSNLVQEAKNGKGKAKIYVNEENSALRDKANSLGGYVVPFKMEENIVDRILEDNPEIM